ncbi:hypothetical protein FRB94_006732 [Tulasnella sp. JGI-2019a]|nr:hypothetical protein FRB94_006732 [Tulasnella sp. JGI-2019a]
MGQALQMMSEMRPPASHFLPVRDIPDLSGKVMIVTGGNNGLGKETIQELLKKNAKVYMASRSRTRAEEAINDLEQKTGKRAIFLKLDLASLDSITKAAREFQRQETVLDVLFNSGGVMNTPVDNLTADGYDLQFGVNCLGHAHFTLLLLPQLIAGAKHSPDGRARVVNISSNAAYGAGSVGIYFDMMTDTPKRRTKALALYSISKYGNVVFSNELAKRYGDQGIVSTALHPGSIETDIAQHMAPWVQRTLKFLLFYPIQYGVLTSLWAGTSPETRDLNGKWLIPWARVGKMGPSKDPHLGEKLWDWIEEQRKGHC